MKTHWLAVAVVGALMQDFIYAEGVNPPQRLTPRRSRLPAVDPLGGVRFGGAGDVTTAGAAASPWLGRSNSGSWEWDHDHSLDWHLLQYPEHAGIKTWMADLNRVYKATPPLYERDFSWDGFEWIDVNDYEESIISFVRRGGSDPSDAVIVVCNFTPVPRHGYRVGVPEGGYWKEVLNSDAREYSGSGVGNFGGGDASDGPSHGKGHSVVLTLPPLGMVVLRKKA